MGRSGPTYFWWLLCSKGCSSEQTSKEPAGNPTWLSEKCPTPQCESKILAYVTAPPGQHPDQ